MGRVLLGFVKGFGRSRWGDGILLRGWMGRVASLRARAGGCDWSLKAPPYHYPSAHLRRFRLHPVSRM